jgi:CHAD domain-containing protein
MPIMEIQNLQLFLDENCKSLKQNFRIAKKMSSPDSIHDLRVAIKRLNALVQLISYRKNSNYRLKRNFAYLKRLFKAAGPLRDLQVLEELFVNFGESFGSISDIMPDQFHIDKKKAERDFLIFAKKYNQFKFNRLFKNIGIQIQNMENKLLNIQIQNIRQSHLLMLKNFSNPDSDVYNLHSARKIVKDFAYWLEMEDKETTQNNDRFLQQKEAGRYLGNWHDRMVLYNFLLSGKKNGLIKTKILKPIIIQVKKEMKEFKEQYFSLYENIISEEVNEVAKPQTKNTA